jgi:hypothetical protein
MENLEGVEAQAMLVSLGGEQVDGGVVGADACLCAPSAAAAARGSARFGGAHALPLPPAHVLQQLHTCMAFMGPEQGFNVHYKVTACIGESYLSYLYDRLQASVNGL